MGGEKVLREQGGNTFKFQSFSERIAGIRIDVIHQVRRHHSETPDDSDTFFHEELEKWSDLNLTEHFVAFHREVWGKTETFAQLVHYQKEIVDSLKKYLQMTDSLALDALTQLLVAFARDLQNDFYPYFQDFFNILVQLLNTQKPDTLEHCFTCLAYLFKFLWRHLVKDFENIFRIYSPLLSSSQKLHIRRFAAESFAFLLRKVKKTDYLLDLVFSSLQTNRELSVGIGHLLFEMVKGIQHQLHSCADTIFPAVIWKLGAVESLKNQEMQSTPQACQELIFEAQKQMMELLLEYLNKDSSDLIWKTLLERESLASRVQDCSFYDQDSLNIENCNLKTTTSRQPFPLKFAEAISQLLKTWEEVPAVAMPRRSKRNGKLKSVITDNTLQYSDGKIVLEQLNYTLKITFLWVDYRNGKFVKLSTEICKVMTRCLSNENLSEECQSSILDITSRFLQRKNGTPLRSDEANDLCKHVFLSKFRMPLIFKFTRQMFSYGMFQKDVLPPLVEHCERLLDNADSDDVINDILHLIVELVVHNTPVIADASQLLSHQIYTLPFHHKSGDRKSFYSLLLRLLGNYAHGGGSARVWATLVVLPHLRNLNITEVVQEVCSLINHLSQKSASIEELMILCQAYITVAVILGRDEFLQLFDFKNVVVDLLRKHPDCRPVLLIADVFLSLIASSIQQEEHLDSDLAELLYSILQDNLSSPYHHVRLLTLRIMSAFTLHLPVIEEGTNVGQPGVFRICLDAEDLQLSMLTYREILTNLRKLDLDLVQHNLPTCGSYDTVPLRYLLGVLYRNFSLLWKPVMELIQTQAFGLPLNRFWEVFGRHLHHVAHLAEKELRCQESSDLNLKHNLFEAENLQSFFQEKLDILTQHHDKPDYSNHRFLLWQAMKGFATRVQGKTRDLSVLLLQFVENEFHPVDHTVSHTQDVRCSSVTNADDTTLDSDTEDVANDQQCSAKDSRAGKVTVPLKRRKPYRRAASKSLVVHLEAFAEFQDPRSMFQEPKLRSLYLDLLTYRTSAVQKAAFKCLLAYKYDYLVPYQENFERLIDDKSFKSEIVNFSVSEDNPVVDAKHRSGVLPILMRVLYGKMLTKSGSKSSRLKNTNVRRGIVLRFLASCQGQDLQVFIDLVLSPFRRYTSSGVLQNVKSLMADLDYTAIIPLKRQISALNTMDVMFSRMGSKIHMYLPEMLQITLGLTAICVQLLENRSQVHPGLINSLKNIRTLCFSRIYQFFMTFDKYPFTSGELDALFEAAVWPALKRLPFESAYSPSLLLKLMHYWSLNSRFHRLLGKHYPDDMSLTPLPYVFQLLSAKNVTSKVQDMVMDIIEHLLAETDDDDDDDNVEEDLPEIAVSHCIEIPPSELHEGDMMTYGTCLLLPHITTILEYLQMVVDKMAKSKGRQKTYPVKELSILSRISMFTLDKIHSSLLIKLLLPYLARNISRPEHVEVDIMKSIANLVKLLDDASNLLAPVVKLCSNLVARVPRITICTILQTMAQKDPGCQPIAEIVTKLNAWDRKRVDEPDYETRLSAYGEINSCIKSFDAMQMESVQGSAYVLAVIHNCCFFINNTDDLSVRDSSSHCLLNLIQKLASVQDAMTARNLKIILEDNLILQNVRHEYILVLSHLVRNFPSHPLFRALVGLTDPDPEADFFENIKHIQVHRRGRAMKKLQGYLQKNVIPPSTVMEFIFPLVAVFLFNESYIKQQNVIDDSINTVGAICKLLPWQSYELIMRRYMTKLIHSGIEYQKQAVRLIVAILDGFHFDLSSCQSVDYMTGQNVESDNVDNDISQEVIEEEKDEETMEVDTATKQDELSTDSTHSAKLSNRINRVISRTVLPQLYKALTRKVKSEDDHKLSHKSSDVGDTEILQVPIAIAMVKLLQKLPAGALEQNLPNLLVKMVELLRSRKKEVRDVTRDTLAKIMTSLGANYLFYLLKELKATLRRGYQRHVLSYSTYTVLKSMEPQFKAGDLDRCLNVLIEIFTDELFGDVSDEKEIAGIVKKVPEAKVVKAFDAFELISKYIGQGCLTKLVDPLKQILDEAKSHKVVKRVQDIVRRLALGLMDNCEMPVASLLICCHGLISDSLPMIKPKNEPSNPFEVRSLRPPSTYLLPPTPGRRKISNKTTPKTNAHVLVEFGLQLLHLCLKRGRAGGVAEKDKEMLDPFVAILVDCISSKHVKITTESLNCLCWILKFDLPSVEMNVHKVAENIFVLLKNYAIAGAAKGDNFDLVVACFKAMTVLVRDVKSHTITPEQLQVLLTYAEQDMYDNSRQSTAFGLLKAILGRKLIIPEIHEVLLKVRKLAIQSEASHIRAQSRQVFLAYLLDYPLGKKLQKHLEFWLLQLEYEYEAGRDSVLDILLSILETFPQNMLEEYSGLLFVPISARVVNDDSPKLRKKASNVVKLLLKKITGNSRDSLFDIVTMWMQDRETSVRRLGAQLCGLFIESEEENFERRIEVVLPIISQQIQSEKYSQDSMEDSELRIQDHLLFCLLNCLHKLLQYTSALRNGEYGEFDLMWEKISSHLLHPHVWVRLVSGQLFGFLFAAYQPEDLSAYKSDTISNDRLDKSASKPEYLLHDTHKKLHDLTMSFCSQLQSPALNKELGDQVVKNLIFIGKVFHLWDKSRSVASAQIDDSEDPSQQEHTSLLWLLRKMNREAKFEASHRPKETIKRSCVFLWLAAMAQHLGKECLPVLEIMLTPLHREINDPQTDEELKTLGNDVVNLMKTMVGVEEFSKVYAQVGKLVAEKKQIRKRQRAVEAVADPAESARKKARKNLKKQENRKRKIERKRVTKKHTGKKSYI